MQSFKITRHIIFTLIASFALPTFLLIQSQNAFAYDPCDPSSVRVTSNPRSATRTLFQLARNCRYISRELYDQADATVGVFEKAYQNDPSEANLKRFNEAKQARLVALMALDEQRAVFQIEKSTELGISPTDPNLQSLQATQANAARLGTEISNASSTDVSTLNQIQNEAVKAHRSDFRGSINKVKASTARAVMQGIENLFATGGAGAYYDEQCGVQASAFEQATDKSYNDYNAVSNATDQQDARRKTEIARSSWNAATETRNALIVCAKDAVKSIPETSYTIVGSECDGGLLSRNGQCLPWSQVYDNVTLCMSNGPGTAVTGGGWKLDDNDTWYLNTTMTGVPAPIGVFATTASGAGACMPFKTELGSPSGIGVSSLGGVHGQGLPPGGVQGSAGNRNIISWMWNASGGSTAFNSSSQALSQIGCPKGIPNPICKDEALLAFISYARCEAVNSKRLDPSTCLPGAGGSGVNLPQLVQDAIDKPGISLPSTVFWRGPLPYPNWQLLPIEGDASHYVHPLTEADRGLPADTWTVAGQLGQIHPEWYQ